MSRSTSPASPAPPPPTTPVGGLPDPPRFDLWPEALRSAELRRGTLVACGPGVRGVGWPDSPRVRLAALAPWLSGGRVAAFRTAAWVWGAAREPGRPLRVTTVGRGVHDDVIMASTLAFVNALNRLAKKEDDRTCPQL